MKPGRAAAALAVLLLAVLSPALAAPARPGDAAAQLDQMLAPVALYPDALVAQILMASTYPLQIVEADRWLLVPANAALAGDRLSAALRQQRWDPSVKSLVPFPPILRMMDANLDWTERLGAAFAADQAGVMDSVQRLRRMAQAAGRLGSTPQQVVASAGTAITIEPAVHDVVYVPVYDPASAYGPWPYPDYPPDYFPGYFDNAVAGAFGFGWCGLDLLFSLWYWHHWDWHRHRLDLDPPRFAALDHGRAPPAGGQWTHQPLHRDAMAYRDAAPHERITAASPAPDLHLTTMARPAEAAPLFHVSPPPVLPRAPELIRPLPNLPPTTESLRVGQETHTVASPSPPAPGTAPKRNGKPGLAEHPLGH